MNSFKLNSTIVNLISSLRASVLKGNLDKKEAFERVSSYDSKVNYFVFSVCWSKLQDIEETKEEEAPEAPAEEQLTAEQKVNRNKWSVELLSVLNQKEGVNIDRDIILELWGKEREYFNLDFYIDSLGEEGLIIAVGSYSNYYARISDKGRDLLEQIRKQEEAPAEEHPVKIKISSSSFEMQLQAEEKLEQELAEQEQPVEEYTPEQIEALEGQHEENLREEEIDPRYL